MPQVTLSVSNEKLPMLKDMLKKMGIETFDARKADTKYPFGADGEDTILNSENVETEKCFSWDNFRSELEFE